MGESIVVGGQYKLDTYILKGKVEANELAQILQTADARRRDKNEPKEEREAYEQIASITLRRLSRLGVLGELSDANLESAKIQAYMMYAYHIGNVFFNSPLTRGIRTEAKRTFNALTWESLRRHGVFRRR